MNNNFQNQQEYTYINGFGFTYNSAEFKEKQMIKTYSAAAALAVLTMFVLRMSIGGFVKNFVANIISLVHNVLPFFDASILIVDFTEIIVYTIALIIPFLLYVKILNVPMSVAFPFKTPDTQKLFPSIAASMGVSVIGIITTAMVGFAFGIFGFSLSTPIEYPPNEPVAFIIYFFKSAILAGFIEEIVFRGALLQSLRRFGDGFAIIVSSIIFAAVHANFVQAPNAFIMGMAIAFSVVITNSLWTGIIIHSMHNGFLVILTVAQQYLSSKAYYILMSSCFTAFLLFAIIGIIYMAKNCDYIFELKPCKTVHKAGEKITFYFTTISMIITAVVIFILSMQYIAYLG